MNTLSLSHEQKLLLAVRQATAKLYKLEEAKSAPIAIIGMACRFPGGADDPAAYWELLKSSADARCDIPQERWDIDRYYDPNPEAPGKIYVRQGYFLKQPIDQFEPAFFGISGLEAAKMDPSQRLVLEVAWEALEDGGIGPKSLKNTNTGVYIGQCFNDYSRVGTDVALEGLPDFYLGTGTAMNITAGRVAYVLGLQGPTLCLDTTCSSSLVTVHLACQSLRQGECDLALAGGVNLMLHPAVTHGFCKGRALAADSRCKTFDASADGYARGEGCGMLVLKRLEAAQADGDRILAVVRGSAINHDGQSSGLTVPNQQAQKKVISQALENARLNPLQVSYVECHGTGTSLGDPLEVKALEQVYCPGRERENPLLLGAVKTNVGHLEAAAGMAGLIKIILAFQHEEIPANLHFQQPNPRIEWDKIPVKVVSETMPWQRGTASRYAGMSGFGMSGTNAHIILSDAPILDSPATPEHPSVLTLSARTQSSLDGLISRYADYLARHEVAWGDVTYTANTGRAEFHHRWALVAQSREEALQKLLKVQQGAIDEVTGVYTAEASSGGSRKIAFLFTGQGSQYGNMGRELYENVGVFREAIEECDRLLGAELDLKAILYPETLENLTTDINQTVYTQPVLFALEYALSKLWQSWGVEPDVVMGHSVGEYVAATVAGVWSLADGLKLIAARGRLMQQLPPGGTMVSLMASEAKVAPLLQNSEVAIAAINGPESVVISGKQEDVETIVSQLESQGIKGKILQVSHGFHSPLMEPMLAEFAAIAKQITYHSPSIPIVSNLTGTLADTNITTPAYWVNHIRQPVQFYPSMQYLAQEEIDIFLEIGSKPILLGMGRECLQGSQKLWLPSLRPGKKDRIQLLQSLGQLYVQGVKIDWPSVHQDFPTQKLSLPTYPWTKRRYWVTDLPERKSPPSPEKPPEENLTLLASRDESPFTPTSEQEPVATHGKIRLISPTLVTTPVIVDSVHQPRIKQQLTPVLVTPAPPAKSIGDRPNSSLSMDITELKQTLKAKLAESLYVDISEIAEDQTFIDLGLDSIVGVEWIATINRLYGLNIKATKLYDHPTLRELTTYIAGELSPGKQVSHLTVPAPETKVAVAPVPAVKPIPTGGNIIKVKEQLKQQLAQVLYLEVSEIGEDEKFIDLGLDSIVGVEWIATINKTWSLEIKATKLYDYPTLTDLSGYIAQLTVGADPVTHNSAPPPVDVGRIPNPRQKLREILAQVARGELTIAVANEMIQKLKQEAKL